MHPTIVHPSCTHNAHAHNSYTAIVIVNYIYGYIFGTHKISTFAKHYIAAKLSCYSIATVATIIINYYMNMQTKDIF